MHCKSQPLSASTFRFIVPEVLIRPVLELTRSVLCHCSTSPRPWPGLWNLCWDGMQEVTSAVTGQLCTAHVQTHGPLPGWLFVFCLKSDALGEQMLWAQPFPCQTKGFVISVL